jgi:diketogulonate reductase-like aldo/keto reductase
MSTTSNPIAERDIPAGRIKAVPRLLYGTAFKGPRTASIVAHALEAGFIGVDTAAVTKAYQEKLVGEAVRSVVAKGDLSRGDIWVRDPFPLHSYALS